MSVLKIKDVHGNWIPVPAVTAANEISEATTTSINGVLVGDNGRLRAGVAGSDYNAAYVKEFNNTTDWTFDPNTSSYKLYVPAAPHNLGAAFTCSVYLLRGGVYVVDHYGSYPTETWKLSVDAEGNAVLETASRFAGKLVLI